VEVGGAETEVGFYDGDGLELSEVLREQILLSLPMQRVCGEGCKGICPVCGQTATWWSACASGDRRRPLGEAERPLGWPQSQYNS